MPLPDHPDGPLLDAARSQLAHTKLAEVLHRHFPYLPESIDPQALSTEIPAGCQMLEFSLRHHQDAALSVSQYFSVALQQYQTVIQIMDRMFGYRDDLKVLDFACGYGRLLRFLIHRLSADQIWAAEIQSDAVDYVSEHFGVHGLQSSAEPENFNPNQRFDVIWVASLFSHLPDGLFQRWLAKLAGLLSPGGILCFSVHDEALLPEDQVVPESGLLYLAGSENPDLDTAIYGTTFVREEYVRSAVALVFGEGFECRRFKKLLAHEQDVYVCCGPQGPDMSGLENFRRGPRGWLDVYRQEGEALYLRGWAASIDDGDLDHLEIEFAGEVMHVTPGESSSDVARVLGDSRLAHCGFNCRLPWPAGQVEPYLVISAVSQQGERALVFAGQLHRQPV